MGPAALYAASPPAAQQAGAERLAVTPALELLAFVEWELAKLDAEAVEPAGALYYAGESVRLRLRFGFEREFAKLRMLPLFTRALDVSVLVLAAELESLAPLESPQSLGSQGRSFALGDEVAQARASSGRDGFQTYQIERQWVLERPGSSSLEAPLLRLAYADRFEDDLLRGRVALDRQEYTLRGAALTLEVQPWPAVGRPLDFTGVVGRFETRSAVSPRDVDLGESVRLSVQLERVDGGAWADRDLPRLAESRGWRVQGTLDQVQDSTRTLTWDLVSETVGVQAVPVYRWSYFDPQAERYELSHSQELDVRVVGPSSVAGRPGAVGRPGPTGLPRPTGPRDPTGPAGAVQQELPGNQGSDLTAFAKRWGAWLALLGLLVWGLFRLVRRR